MVSSTTIIAQNNRIKKSQDQSLITQFHIFTKENVFFFLLKIGMSRFFYVLKLKNREIPITSGRLVGMLINCRFCLCLSAAVRSRCPKSLMFFITLSAS